MEEQRGHNSSPEPVYTARRDGLADERDDRQLHPYDDQEAAENAGTSLDQPSDGDS